ncbi:MAG: 30S ribosomal protein S6 [Rhodothermales bacterium]|nr:30S ribosomal protein S6 [Rhodothermales bacterium]
MADNNTYELTYIVNAALSDDQIKDIVARVHKFLEESGAESIETEEWGNQRLAYPINKKRNGFYVNVYFQSDGDAIVKLERALEINDSVLRYLTLRMDAKMLRHFESRKERAAAAKEVEAN